MDISIGKYLEYLRLSCGYSLRHAAKKTKLSHGYIRDVELGNNRSSGSEIIPMPQTLKKFADAYSASFDELMSIAGHVYTAPKQEFEFIELDFSTVMYIEVDCNNNVIYHAENCNYIEYKSLHDYVLFEEQLEKNSFLRVQSGLYANLFKIKSYDSSTGRLYFSENTDGLFIKLNWVKAANLNKIILRAIKNNSDCYDYSVDVRSFRKIIRNIVTH